MEVCVGECLVFQLLFESFLFFFFLRVRERESLHKECVKERDHLTKL